MSMNENVYLIHNKIIVVNWDFACTVLQTTYTDLEDMLSLKSTFGSTTST